MKFNFRWLIILLQSIWRIATTIAIPIFFLAPWVTTSYVRSKQTFIGTEATLWTTWIGISGFTPGVGLWGYVLLSIFILSVLGLLAILTYIVFNLFSPFLGVARVFLLGQLGMGALWMGLVFLFFAPLSGSAFLWGYWATWLSLLSGVLLEISEFFVDFLCRPR